MLIFSIIAISILLNLLPALLVIFSNPRSVTHRSFFALTVAFVSYGLINYVSLHPVFLSQIAWIRLDLFVGTYVFLLVYLTFLAFPNTHFPRLTKVDRFFIVFSVFVSVLTLTPAVFSHLKHTPVGVQPVPAPGIGLFVIQQVSMVLLTARLFIRKLRSSQGVERRQLQTVISGATFAVVAITFFNFVAVQVFHTDILVPYSSLAIIVFTLNFTFALVHYRFLNFRLLVARSVAYLLLLSSMVGAYGLVVFIITDELLGNKSVFLRELVSLLAALVLALTASYLKKFFDRLTTKIFYQDAYDPQIFLDQLNQVFVANIDLQILLKRTSQVIEEHLKSSFCLVALPATETKPRRIIGSGTVRMNASDSQLIQDQLESVEQQLLFTDDLGQHHEKLKKILEAQEIAVIMRLTPVHSTNPSQTIAYLLIGSKKSGNVYDKQDLRIIQIIGNELAITIQNALRFEEIQNFNTTLQARINEATRKLRHANEKLKALDETKDDFISMASHQLRTPLTSIKGYISMVLEQDAGTINKTQKEMLNQAFFSSQRMVYLIADLLNISRLKTGKFVIEPTKVNLAELVKQELSQIQETAAGHSLTLTYDKPKTFPDLMLDETKTRQVIMNFIDNAIYYTPANGHIHVRLIDNPNDVELRIEDDGIGVPKAEQPHLFTKFFRADNATKARPDGTGLGLFMAKKVIVAQGGSIIFDSKENQGSTFGFLFNKAKHTPGATPDAAKTPIVAK